MRTEGGVGGLQGTGVHEDRGRSGGGGGGGLQGTGVHETMHFSQ